jgi:hypothetical protein
MLPEQAIAEFKMIYKKRFGVDLTDKQALEKATRLFCLYKAVYESPVINSYVKKLR